jgi:hypothetical protein
VNVNTTNTTATINGKATKGTTGKGRGGSKANDQRWRDPVEAIRNGGEVGTKFQELRAARAEYRRHVAAAAAEFCASKTFENLEMVSSAALAFALDIAEDTDSLLRLLAGVAGYTHTERAVAEAAHDVAAARLKTTRARVEKAEARYKELRKILPRQIRKPGDLRKTVREVMEARQSLPARTAQQVAIRVPEHRKLKAKKAGNA